MLVLGLVAVLYVLHPTKEYPSVLSGVVYVPTVGWFLALYVIVFVVMAFPFVPVPKLPPFASYVIVYVRSVVCGTPVLIVMLR